MSNGCMTDLDLIPDEDLIKTIQKRLDAKGLAYIFIWGTDDAESWLVCQGTDDREQIVDMVAQLEYDDSEDGTTIF